MAAQSRRSRSDDACGFQERARRRRSRGDDDNRFSRSNVFSDGPVAGARQSAIRPSQSAIQDSHDARRPRQLTQGPDPRQRRRHAGAAGLLVHSPRHMILIGLAIMIVSQAATFAGVEPFASWNTPICWTGFILFADGIVYRARGNSWIRSAPREFAALCLASIALWLVFEGYNLVIRNWIYVGLPENPALRSATRGHSRLSGPHCSRALSSLRSLGVGRVGRVGQVGLRSTHPTHSTY